MKRIEKTSNTYKRRMVQAIRASSEHGVYPWEQPDAQGTRVLNAKFSKGNLQVRISDPKRLSSFGWITVPDDRIDSIFDGYGRHIVASTVTK